MIAFQEYGLNINITQCTYKHLEIITKKGKQEYYHTKEDDIFSSWVTIIIIKEFINKILKQTVIFCKLCHLKPLSILKIAVKVLPNFYLGFWIYF